MNNLCNTYIRYRFLVIEFLNFVRYGGRYHTRADAEPLVKLHSSGVDQLFMQDRGHSHSQGAKDFWLGKSLEKYNLISTYFYCLFLFSINLITCFSLVGIL